MFNLGPGEMLLFAIVAILLFGAKLPEVARNLGGSYRDLKKTINDFQREFQNWDKVDPKPRPVARIAEDAPREAAAPKFVPPPEDDDSTPAR